MPARNAPPAIQSLSHATDIAPDILDHLAAQGDSLYHRFPLAGPNKVRWIEAPRPALKAAQRALLDTVLYRLAPTDFAHGFVPGRSILTHARPHCRQRYVVTADLCQFFPSIAAPRLHPIADELGLGDDDRRRLVGLTTFQGRLPQGAPTSPHLANLVCRPLDYELADLAASWGWAYTRYADDLAFSGEHEPARLLTWVRRCVARHGFRLHPRKTRVMGRQHRQFVTALVVNEHVAVPREQRRRLRAFLHHARLHGWDDARTGPPDQLLAHLAFVQFILPEHAQAMLESFAQLCPRQ